jgi:putative transposase
VALNRPELLEVLDALKAADLGDRIRADAESIYQAFIEAELTEAIGASLHVRSASRSALRNGHRARRLSTIAGTLELRIPKLRTGSFRPRVLRGWHRLDQALFAMVMEAYLPGVSTRTVDNLVTALCADTGIPRSEVSRICDDLATDIGAFRDRSLTDQAFPYVFLDTTSDTSRANGRIVPRSVVIATGMHADGRREALGFTLGDSEDDAFWTAFLQGLTERGLGGVRLVISDAGTGLAKAVAAALPGASWRRCPVHLLRSALVQVPEGSSEMVAAAIRTTFT